MPSDHNVLSILLLRGEGGVTDTVVPPSPNVIPLNGLSNDAPEIVSNALVKASPH